MAKQTHDREDLLRDGTAMSVRGRLLIDDVEVVIGFRSRGQLSLYWGQDPVFQFDELGKLRRVFFDSIRFKAHQGRLAQLTTSSDEATPPVGRLRLTVQPVSDSDQHRILQRLSDCLQQIEQIFEKQSSQERFDTLQCVGATQKDFASRVRDWITGLDQPPTIAKDPSA